MSPPDRHSLIDDAQGIAYGAVMAAFAITVLTNLGLVTGQTAGLAVLVSYATGWGFGPVFFAVNLPFYWFGYRRFGAVFVAQCAVAADPLPARMDTFAHPDGANYFALSLTPTGIAPTAAPRPARQQQQRRPHPQPPARSSHPRPSPARLAVGARASTR